MSFTFQVLAPELPALARCIEAAALPFPVEIAHAESGGAWPRGRIAKLSDLSSAPLGPDASPSEAAVLARVGMTLSFLVHAHDLSARGVEVRRDRDGVAFRVLALSSEEDYRLALGLACAAARLAGARVQAEHGPDGRAIDALAPEVALDLFGGGFIARNALEMATGVRSSLRLGTAHVYTPRGWVHVPGGEGTDQAWRVATLARLRRPPPAPAIAIAELLVGAMLSTVAADGTVGERERTALSALAQSVAELRDVDVAALVPRAAAALESAPGFPEWVRRKAFVLACEAVCRGSNGVFAAGDASLRGIVRLQYLLGLSEEFAAGALFAARCKYTAGEIEAAHAGTMLDVMLSVAAADGRIATGELLALQLILMTVPQFEAMDGAPAITASIARLGAGAASLAERIANLPRFRDKTYAMACEIAFAGGLDPAAESVLATLEELLPVSKQLPAQARATFAAKYASG